MGIFTFNADRGYALAKEIRANSNAKIIIGGLHATLNFTETANHCDYVLIGEGDETIVKVIDALKNGKPLNFPEIVHYKDGELIHYGNPPLPQDINTIPNRNLLYNFKKIHPLQHNLATSSRLEGMPSQLWILRISGGIRAESSV